MWSVYKSLESTVMCLEPKATSVCDNQNNLYVPVYMVPFVLYIEIAEI